MRAIGIAILILIALFTGGCSLLSLLTFGTQSLMLSGPGLLIAAGCIMWLNRINWKDRKP